MHIMCDYCGKYYKKDILLAHHKVCIKNPNIKFIVVLLDAGEPDVISSIYGITYYDSKFSEKYANARIQKISYGIFKNQKLISKKIFIINDDNRDKTLKKLLKAVKTCDVYITFNSIKDIKILNAELFRIGTELHTWVFSISECAVNMGFLSYQERHSIEILWNVLFGEKMPDIDRLDIYWKCLLKMHSP